MNQGSRLRVRLSRSLVFAVLALSAIAVFILACILPSYAVNGQLAARESRVRAILASYQRHGLFTPHSLANLPQFGVSKGSFTYKAFDQANLDNAIKAFMATDPKFIKLNFFDFVTYMGHVFTQGTDFADKIQVNEPPKDDFINIYFLDADPDNLAKNFDNNCEYIGILNAIICSAQFISDQYAEIDQYRRTYDIVLVDTTTNQPLELKGANRDLVLTQVKESFLMWLLGHEIGHAVLHKKQVLSGGPLHFDLSYSLTEQEADEFAARRIVNDIPQAATFWVATGEYIQQKFRSEAISENRALTRSDLDDPNFALNTKLNVAYTRYHVPLLLRALRVENLLLRLAPQIDSTGFYEIVEKNVSTENRLPPRVPAVRAAIISAVLIGGCIVIAINRRKIF